MRRLFTIIAMLATLQLGAQECIIHGDVMSKLYDGLTIYLTKIGIGDRSLNELADSAVINDGHFTFHLSAPEKPYLSSLALPLYDRYHTYGLEEAYCIVEAGEQWLTYKNRGVEVKGGGKMTRAYDDLKENERRVRDTVMTMRSTMDKPDLSIDEQEAYNARINKMYSQLRPQICNFIRENIHTDVGACMLFSYAPSYFPEDLYTQLTGEVNPEYLQRYQAKLLKIQAEQEAQQQAIKMSRTGQPYRDFASRTSQNQVVRMSNYVKKGHVVLLDFWASWCGPCRQEIPTLKKLYEQYHCRGLDIVSVSLDTQRNAWEKAMEKEQMPWPQLSTLEGFNSEAAKNYAVGAIPFLVVIDGEGRIAQVNMHGQKLEDKIRELLN